MAKQWDQLQDHLYILSHLNLVNEQLLAQIQEHNINEQLTLTTLPNFCANDGSVEDKNDYIDQLNSLNQCIKIVSYETNLKVCFMYIML